MKELQIIDESLMYKVLSIPSYSGKEYRMIAFLLEYMREKEYKGGVDG